MVNSQDRITTPSQISFYSVQSDDRKLETQRKCTYNTRAYNDINRNLILHTEAKLTSALVLECGCVKMCSVKEKHHVTSRTTADNINTTLSLIIAKSAVPKAKAHPVICPCLVFKENLENTGVVTF